MIITANDSNAEDMVVALSSDTLRLMFQAQTGAPVCADDCQAPAISKLRQVPAAIDRKRLAGFYAFTAFKGVFRIRDTLYAIVRRVGRIHLRTAAR